MSKHRDYLAKKCSAAKAVYAGAVARHKGRREARRQFVQAKADLLRQEIEDTKAARRQSARDATRPGSFAGDLFNLCNS